MPGAYVREYGNGARCSEGQQTVGAARRTERARHYMRDGVTYMSARRRAHGARRHRIGYGTPRHNALRERNVRKVRVGSTFNGGSTCRGRVMRGVDDHAAARLPCVVNTDFLHLSFLFIAIISLFISLTLFHYLLYFHFIDIFINI